MREPIRPAPLMFGSDDFRMFDTAHRFAFVEEEMANYTPGGRNIELFKQSEQTIDYDLKCN